MNRYNPSEIEPKWQQIWTDTELYKVTEDPTRPKYYMLTEFPYPSGDGLHAGHIREYTIGDVLSRHQRMLGKNVLYPMGYDAFGLPTENYAIKHKIAPQVATDNNIGNFRKQFDQLGFSFDWSRSVNTTDPDYYRWTQWLFLQFLKAGLAYQDEIAINWCPKEKTGLANEEVVNGKHERCGTPVEKKFLKQWLFRITDYADRLIDGLKTVDFPDKIASQQINWIGRSVGAEISWAVCDADGNEDGQTIVTFTTRKDTIPGVTFIVVAPELPILAELTDPDQAEAVAAYIERAQSMSDIERQENKHKTGVATGKYAKNPFNGIIVPIYVADYVLGGYGTGVVMGMGGHDERDREFAHKYNLPLILTTAVPAEYADLTELNIYKGEGKQINSGPGYDGLSNKQAGDKIFAELVAAGKAKAKTQYKLRDWVFSRQHYWGEPIPVIHCPKDGIVPVPEDHLPVTLPPVESYEPTDTGESPLAAMTDWVNVDCPKCGGPAKRETDTMPNWAGSNWYYLRYMDAHNNQAFVGQPALDYWQNVDMYLGGMEHTTLHLLYSRFCHQFLYDQGLVPTPEPYAARRGQGIVLAADGRKMSKSIGNVINPSDIVAKYGADSLRLYVLFMAPYDETTPWSDERLGGVNRFVHRVYTLVSALAANQSANASDLPDGTFETNIDRLVHKTLKKVHDDLHEMRFNTAIAAMMELLNGLATPKALDRLIESRHAQLAARTAQTFVLMLAPFAPYLAEELWHTLGRDDSIHTQTWPTYDPELIKDDVAELAVQVNGKLRGTILVAMDASDAEVTAAAKANPNVAKYLDGEIVKTIVVPRRLVGFVVK